MEKIDFHKYENIIVGFWCDKETMDNDSINFVKGLKNKKLYFLGTLGARPSLITGRMYLKMLKKLCTESNDFIDGLLIWGRISKEMIDMMMKFPEDNPHAATPERIAR